MALPATKTFPHIAAGSGPFGGLAINNDGGAEISPPDPTGSIGPKNYVEVVNAAIGVYDRNLHQVSENGLTGFVGAPTSVSYCNAQVQWDQAAARWFYAFRFCNAITGSEDFHFGWSRSADPSTLNTTAWCNYLVATGSEIEDSLRLGHNNNYLIIGANAFDDTTNPFPFIGTRVFTVTKPALGTTVCPNASTLSLFAFGPLLSQDGLPETTTPVPVDVMTSSATGYVVASYDVSASGPKAGISLWQVNSAGQLSSAVDINDPVAFSAPSPAMQPGAGAPTIDTLDGRLSQATGDPNTSIGLWTSHTVNGPGGRSTVRWYQIQVPPFNGAPSLIQHGDIASTTDSVFNGSIAPRLDGDGAAIFYNRSSSGTLPLIAAQIRLASTAAGATEPGEMVIGPGDADGDFTCTTPFGPPCLWGTYSGASSDPVDHSLVWGSNMLISGSNAGTFPNWYTWNFGVLPAVLAHPPTSVSAVAGNSSAVVTWTPSTYDAGTPTTGYSIDALVGSNIVGQQTAAAAAGSTTFSGLTNGVAYRFSVGADNFVGAGPQSSLSNAVTPVRQTAQAPGAGAPALRGISPTSTSGTPGARGVSTSGGDAGNYQIDPTHTGAVRDSRIVVPLSMKWSKTFPVSAIVGVPVVAGGRVFAALEGGAVYAFDLAGNQLWTATGPLGGFLAGIAYDNGRLFLLTSNGLAGFDAASGSLQWQLAIAGGASFPPTATGGVVYVGGANSSLAVNEASGAVLWGFGRQSGSPAVVGNSDVFLADACINVNDVSATTGVSKWLYTRGCIGGGVSPVELYQGRLYVQGDFTTYVFDAGTGKLLTTFSAGGQNSGPPAFSQGIGYFLTGSTLTALTLDGYTPIWASSFAGDGSSFGPPIIANGLVFVESDNGNLYALDAATGVQQWSMALPAALGGGPQLQQGLALADGLLVVPASNTLTAFGD